ncbi:unnamed protein product [Malus baccata var. baccata]
MISVVIGKTNEKGLKTLSFNDKDKLKGKLNSTMFDFLESGLCRVTKHGMLIGILIARNLQLFQLSTAKSQGGFDLKSYSISISYEQLYINHGMNNEGNLKR